MDGRGWIERAPKGMSRAGGPAEDKDGAIARAIVLCGQNLLFEIVGLLGRPARSDSFCGLVMNVLIKD